MTETLRLHISHGLMMVGWRSFVIKYVWTQYLVLVGELDLICMCVCVCVWLSNEQQANAINNE